MIRKNIIVKLSIVMLGVFLLSACSNTTNSDTTDTENISSEITIDNITYIEKDAHFEVADAKYVDNTLVDGEVMDWTTWEKVDKNIHLKDSIDVYSHTKAKGGYTKENIDAIYVAVNGEWSHIVIGESRYGIYVRTDELENVMEEIVEETEVKEDETVSEEINEPTYTVTDMDKTMYAKQSVNIRKGPGTEYDKVGSLTTNTEVTVTGKTDNNWYRINYNGIESYVNCNYLVDEKVVVNTTPSDTDGNTNENENNSVETSPTYTIEDMINSVEITPEAPEAKYTAEEVISIVRSTMESNGIVWSVDYASPEDVAEFGPDLGMSWGLCEVPMDDPYTYANGMVEGSLYQGFDLYYLEYLYTENGYVVLKTYFGTQW